MRSRSKGATIKAGREALARFDQRPCGAYDSCERSVTGGIDSPKRHKPHSPGATGRVGADTTYQHATPICADALKILTRNNVVLGVGLVLRLPPTPFCTCYSHCYRFWLS